MQSLKLLLIPFAWLYGLVVRLRHYMFNKGILRSTTFPIPLIGVGNLSFGGTGKTPLVEYLIRLLYEEQKIATLSRGYGRQTTGFLIGNQFSRHGDIGDEPMQYVRKFGKIITVAVDEKRTRGIEHLMDNDKTLAAIILDDIFQHRYVKPGLSLLLTDYHKLYMDDYLFPAGSLRDTIRVAPLADIIIVTKCPRVLSPIIRKDIEKKLSPLSHQQLYFSYLSYGSFSNVPGLEKKVLPEKINSILLFTGIANSLPLQEHLRDHCEELTVVDFTDHHVFKQKDIDKIKRKFDDIYTPKKIIVTTEKDAMRLMDSEYLRELNEYPIFFLPVEVVFHKGDDQNFNTQILNYVKENKRNR